MNLSSSHGQLYLISLRDSLTLLDESLDKIKALKISKLILKEKENIEIHELLDILECQKEVKWNKIKN